MSVKVGEMGDKLKILQDNRDKILLAEIGALIHDLGKLNEIFVRKQSLEGKEYDDYYHSKILEYDFNKHHKYYSGDCEMEHLAKILFDLLKRKIKLNGEETTLYEIIEKHHNDNVDKVLLKFIKVADQFDADEDRAGAKDEQSICKTFKSSTFGYEKEIDITTLLSERKKSYKEIIKYLDSLLTAISCNFSYEHITKLKNTRENCFEKIKESFSKTLGMTARSANDVLLWEHSYMTATIMKCLVAQKILEPDFEASSKHNIKNKKPFSVFSIGWDFFGFIEQSHKIPDIAGRIGILDEIKREIKNIIEVNYALGNEIYSDDFGIHFLIPSALKDEDLNEIKEKIFDIFNEKTDGILLPIFVLTEDTNGDYKIGKLLSESIKKLKRKIDKKEFELLKIPKFIENIKSNRENNYLVCEVCGKGVYNKNDKEKLCETCKEIRKKGREQKQPPQTIYIDEISWNPEKKEYEKICLLVAKFDLDDWLNGTYIESLFIKNPYLDYEDVQWMLGSELRGVGGIIGKALKDKIGANEFDENAEKNIKNELKEKFKAEKIKILRNNTLENVINDVLLYIENQWKNGKTLSEILKEENKHFSITKNVFNFEYLDYNGGEKLLKPSSPSRIMRVWNTTKEFFNEIEKNICLRVPLIEEVSIKIKLSEDENNLSSGVAYLIEINELNLKGEAVYNKDSKELIVITPHLSEILRNKKDIVGKEITIIDSNNKESITTATIEKIENSTRKVRAFRTISKSPTMFMAIIPASKSFEIAKMIKAKYEEEFGKVYGKLPLHIGLIYGKRKTPMYVFLDSAKRMLKKFDEKPKDNGEDNKITFEVKKTEICLIDKTVKIKAINKETNFEYEFRVPFKLGDGSVDYYHPYLEVESSNNVICVYAGDKQIIQKHVLKIEPEDKLKFNKYYFDFEYLDSNIRRFDLGIKRKHWLFTDSENKSKPYLLWDLDNFDRLNRLIKEYGLTNTQIMNLYELLISKIEDWNLKNIEELKENEEFKKFVENAILDIPLRLKSKIDNNKKEFLINSILNGLFFDFVDLWHTILKKDFGGGKNE